MLSIDSHASRVGRNVSFLLACCIIAVCPAQTRAELNSKQARKLISRMAGLELPGDSVRIKAISHGSDGSAEITAEIKTIFKFEKDSAGRWRVAEIRTGQDRWVQVDHIARALNSQVVPDNCTGPDPPFEGSTAVDPSLKRARCLVASLLGVDLPSDEVRIQQVSPLGIPLASRPSAIVEALVTVHVRVVNGAGRSSRVSELRTGNRDWVRLEPLAASVDAEKQKQARAEMAVMAGALEKFCTATGFYIASDSLAVAMDHLSPRYLAVVIRIDPWQRPYKYQGERERFSLRSVGPDGKDGTADDIEHTSSSR